jgi:iron complex transport system ATP-binding protein
MIAVENLSVTLNRRHLLRSINLQVRAGAITVVIGPNGSGKSTLLKAICQDLPFAGTVRINEVDASSMTLQQAAGLRAVLSQNNTLPFLFTVREVVAIGLTGGNAGVPESERKGLPERALAAVDLPDYGGRYYGELSGGEQQRVHLARVLCQVWTPVLDRQPRYLLLDEPVSSLDIRHQLLVMDVARGFAQAGGGVLAVLHDLNLAAMYADQIVALRDGQVVASGAPIETLTDQHLEQVFDSALRVNALPQDQTPFVLPQSVVPVPGAL